MTQKIVNSGLPDWTFVAIFGVFGAVRVKNYEETHRNVWELFSFASIGFLIPEKKIGHDPSTKNDFSYDFSKLKKRHNVRVFSGT